MTTYAFGFDFRNTLAYVTDPADCVSVIRVTGQPYYAAYPVTRTINGHNIVAGWESYGSAEADLSATYPRIAGMWYQHYGTSADVFRVDLPGGAGVYAITVGAGQGYSPGAKFILKDNTTALVTIGTTNVGSGNILDLSGTVRTVAAFDANNGYPVNQTFASSILRLCMTGDGTNVMSINHLYISGPIVAANVPAAAQHFRQMGSGR